jgi:uncharacterized protein YkwD
MRHRSIAVLTTAAALVVGLAVAAPAEAAGTASPAAFDRTDEATITAAYERLLAPSLAEELGWTGNLAGCDAGTVSVAQQRATQRVVNFARRLAGLTPVRLDPALSAKAQQAALVYAANGRLSHRIPASWTCATPDAQQAGRHSDIALGAGGASAVLLYLDDPGTANLAAGHRRWILNPAAKRFGSGSTTTSNALWVIGAGRAKGTYADPRWVTWPTSGWFPVQLEPDGLWSISSGGNAVVDWSNARVTVTSAAGRSLRVKVHKPKEGFGQPTLTWTVQGAAAPATGDAAVYTVKVAGVIRDGKTVGSTYRVRLYDPTKR